MMLRFMEVDFSHVADGSARIPSSVGNMSKAINFADGGRGGLPVKSPAEEKARWDGECFADT
jgi:carboxypeptidase D